MDEGMVTPGATNATYNSDSVTGDAQYVELQFLFAIIVKYVWILPVGIGIPGNTLAIIVANRKHNRHLSPCVYMTAMAVVDTLFLLQLAWYFPLVGWGLGAHITFMREYIFKLELYFANTCGMLSSVFLAAMSIDRLIAVRFPMSVTRLCTTRKAKATIIAATVSLTIINLHFLYVFNLAKDPYTGVEVIMIYADNKTIEILSSVYQMVVGTVCPFLVIFVCNLIIIITVTSASKQRSRMSEGQGQMTSNRKETHLTRMLIFVSAAYLITSLPLRIYHVIVEIPEVAAVYDMSDTYWNLRYNIEATFLFKVWCINFSINFYLYCIGGGQRYRKDTIEVLRCMGSHNS